MCAVGHGRRGGSLLRVVDTGAKRLGARVRLERGRRWRFRRDFAAAIQYKDRTVAALENGERSNFSPEFKGAVEAALGWEVGDFDRVRSGLEPNRHHAPDLVRMIDLWPLLDEGVRVVLLELAERSRGSE